MRITVGLLIAAVISQISTARRLLLLLGARTADILQPAQKVFISWDPVEKVETLHGAAQVRGQRPRLRHGDPDAEPAQAARDAARFLQAPRRLLDPQETRVPALQTAAAYRRRLGNESLQSARRFGKADDADGQRSAHARRSRSWKPGVVGSLDYKIIEADRADDLFQWLKDNKYSYAGDEATPQLLRAEEVAVHRHEDRHHADEEEQGRHLRRRSHADALPVRHREARLPAQDHADQREGQDRGPLLRPGAVQGRSARAT